jgi:hypothetical protein
MSTAQKYKSGGMSNKIVYIVIAAAAIIFLVLLILLVKFIGLPADGSGQDVKYGKGNQRGGNFAKGEGASTLKPEEVFKAFLTELGEGQTEDAYQRTSRGFQSSMSQNDFNTFIEKNKALIRWETYRIKGHTGGSSMQKWVGHVGGGPNGACDFTMEIGQEPEGWRVTKFTVP